MNGKTKIILINYTFDQQQKEGKAGTETLINASTRIYIHT